MWSDEKHIIKGNLLFNQGNIVVMFFRISHQLMPILTPIKAQSKSERPMFDLENVLVAFLC